MVASRKPGGVTMEQSGMWRTSQFELLNAPGEWFFDEATNLLYMYPNGSLPSEGIGMSR